MPLKILAIFFLFAIKMTAAQTPQLSALSSFFKPVSFPILKADSSLKFFCPVKQQMVNWQKAEVFNPAAIVRHNKVYLFARSEDNPMAMLGARTSRIGLAISNDGINFKQHKSPVLYPDSGFMMKYDYPGGCEDPRVVETEDGHYIMAYTSWNYKIPRLSIAVSSNLLEWQKKGVAFGKAYNGKFLDLASKSASIVTRVINNRPIAVKIDGKYWMYWGEKFVNLAWSENGIDWTPQLDESGNLKQIMTTRKGKFDSDLTECGPPAIITDKGILLIYNGKNSGDSNRDTTLPVNTYTVGEVVFDLKDMQTIVQRSDTCLVKPTLPFEITGQYKAGTTFSEGLIFYRKRWWIYYGTADSYVGVAVAD